MIQFIFEKHILIYTMLGLCGLGIIIKLLISFCYGRLVKASDQMGSSENKLMKVLRMKFETCYKLKIGVTNVDTFVDKYIYKHKMLGIYLYTWENFGGQLFILCIMIGTIGAVLGLVYDCGKYVVLSTLFIGVLTSGLLITFENMINLHTKKCVIRINIRDYLENFLKVRLEKEYFHPEELEEYRNEYFEKEKTEKKDKTEEIAENVVNRIMNSMDISAMLDELEDKPKELDKPQFISEKKDKKKLLKMTEHNEKNEEQVIEEILREYLA